MEELIYQRATRMCDEEETTYSDYIRGLIIEDLRTRGLITDREIAGFTVVKIPA